MWRAAYAGGVIVYVTRLTRMEIEALQARLQVLEEQILRLTKLATQAAEQGRQDDYWRLAQDLQREARELRAQIRKAETANPVTGRPEVRGSAQP